MAAGTTGGGAGYAQAMIGVVDLLSGASADAAYEAAYGQFYTSYQNMHNAANQKVAAEANISAIKSDRILTDNIISMQQDRAEAEAKVIAAAAGVEGQSITATIEQTKTNSAIAKGNAKQSAEQQIDNQLATIYQAQSTLEAVDNVQISKPSALSSVAMQLAPVIAQRGDEMVDTIGGWFESSGDVLLPE